MNGATSIEIQSVVNGMPRASVVAPRLTVAEYLRDDLGLTGTKTSCEMEVCGVCSVLVDGRPVSACTALAADLDGAQVTTVEGLADGDSLSELQQAFIEKFATQCGFCTPGFLIMGTALLEANPDPTHEEIAEYLDGNICRCTGYRPIIEAVLLAADRLREAR
ncbi:MAG: (2Fe-2S)-binding protein [Acidimicrobiia bacterium]|nr:(2Fe-2S)-binding protein [Acidimicrobiia bacterium]